MDKKDNKAAWEQFNKDGIVPSDDDVLSMLQDVIDTIQTLTKMFSKGQAGLVITGLIPTYQSLESMAWHRKLENIPRL